MELQHVWKCHVMRSWITYLCCSQQCWFCVLLVNLCWMTRNEQSEFQEETLVNAGVIPFSWVVTILNCYLSAIKWVFLTLDSFWVRTKCCDHCLLLTFSFPFHLFVFTAFQYIFHNGWRSKGWGFWTGDCYGPRWGGGISSDPNASLCQAHRTSRDQTLHEPRTGLCSLLQSCIWQCLEEPRIFGSSKIRHS